MRWLLALGLSLSATICLAQESVSGGVVKIGVLNDPNGPYADTQGPGSVAAARLAIEDFGPTVLGKPIQLVTGDHQNKADIGAEIARRWITSEGVDMLTDLGNSAVSLAVQEVVRGKAVALHVGSAVDTLIRGRCSPTGFMWAYDTGAIARGVGKGLLSQANDTWFLIGVDYAFSTAMERELREVIEQAGGKVVGSVKHPLGSTDFGSYLLQAQASGAKVIGLLNAFQDTNNAIKQAVEFGLVANGRKLATTIFYIQSAHALGLEVMQGTQIVTAFYWDRTEASRDFTRRFRAAMKRDAAPSQIQAGVYSSVLNYLKAVQAAGTDEPMAVSKKLREIGVDDPLWEKAAIRADGRVMKEMFLAQVKTPAESKYPWDYYKNLERLPAADIIKPVSSECPLPINN